MSGELPGSGQTCQARNCGAAIRSTRPFCGFHWQLASPGLRDEWRNLKPDAPRLPLLSRTIEAIERAQFGERML